MSIYIYIYIFFLDICTATLFWHIHVSFDIHTSLWTFSGLFWHVYVFPEIYTSLLIYALDDHSVFFKLYRHFFDICRSLWCGKILLSANGSLVGMGWLRLVGSLKLQVSLAEYRLFYRAPLQKRHIILRSLLIVATPCLQMGVWWVGVGGWFPL